MLRQMLQADFEPRAGRLGISLQRLDRGADLPAFQLGWPRKLTPDQVDYARTLIERETETHADAAALLSADATTLRRALKRA